MHNFHHYFIFANLIIFTIYYFKIFKNQYFKNLIIGFLFTLGTLTIIVTGIIWGLIFLTLVFYFRYKKIINNNQTIFFLLGASLSISIYYFSNLEEIGFLFKSKEVASISYEVLLYKIKFSTLNIFQIFFGQHGNNLFFLITALIYLNKKTLIKDFDKNVYFILIISIVLFIVLGIIVDPLHYYPSRLGILTPLSIYLFLKIYITHDKSNFF